MAEHLGSTYQYPTYLEHYFKMLRADAEQALVTYRHFCKQAEYAVEFLGVAKKLQNVLNVVETRRTTNARAWRTVKMRIEELILEVEVLSEWFGPDGHPLVTMEKLRMEIFRRGVSDKDN